MKPARPGEMVLAGGAPAIPDAGVTFIGHIRSPWLEGNCPKNIAKAREAKPEVRIDLKPEYAPALSGLEVGQPVILIYWMDAARRDMLRQFPPHVDAPRGTFALRSPNRPNPVTLSTVVITSLDEETGVIGVDAIDCFDGTPLIDIKPWLPSVDMPPA